MKNIIVTAVNIIFIMTRDFKKALTERTKSASHTLSSKKIDKKNVEEFFNVKKRFVL